MADNRNPDHNPMLQALLDMAEMGVFAGDATRDQMIAALEAKTPAGRKLRRDTQAKWNSHQYPDRSITYAQVAVAPQLTGCLSPEALSVLIFLGTHCLQSGLIRVTYDTISRENRISRTKAREAITELKNCGAIGIFDKSRRHSAPIYSVDPALVNIGKRPIEHQHKEHMRYVDIPSAKHLLQRVPEWDVVVKSVTMPYTVVETDDKGEPHEVERRIRFADVSAEPHKKAPEPGSSKGNETNDGTKPSTQTNPTTRKPGGKPRSGEKAPQIPGQMTVTDFPEYMPDLPLEGYDDDLPPGFFTLDEGKA